jgi:CelD/BcsL family acetyltransferase involved in cellulose biosynthesis
MRRRERSSAWSLSGARFKRSAAGYAPRALGDAGTLRLDTIDTHERFALLANEGWDDLVRAMARPTPFLLHSWISAWWEHEAEGGRVAVHVAYRDGRLVGGLPLHTSRRGGLRVTSFVGGVHSALADVMVAPGEPAETARAIVAQAAAGAHDYVDLFGLPEGSLFSRSCSKTLRTVERVEAPVLDLTPGWDAVYRAKTDSKKRNLHKRRRRQLSELGDLEVVRARTPDELEAAIEDAFRLHELRWAGRPDGSGFVTPAGLRFNRAALAGFARDDLARIVLLRVGGRAVAFHYFLVFENRMYVYRLGFDPELGRYSPGLVNTLDALEWAGEEGIERVEYLGGGERYKLELSDRLEPLQQGLGLARTPQGAAAVAANLAMIRVRKQLKQSPALHRLYFDRLGPARRLAARLAPTR